MKLTVNEALKLKNEIASKVNKLSDTYDICYGVRYKDGEAEQTDNVKFLDRFETLSKVLDYSNEINTRLAEFNAKGISELVRARQNNNLLISTLEIALGNSSATASTTKNPDGSTTVHQFIPDNTKADLKEQIKKLKRVNRDIDSEIFKLNANEIELSFDYEELDLLS